MHLLTLILIYQKVIVNLDEAFGQAMRECRAELGISQEMLGFRAGVHRTYISQLERGIKSPSLKVIALLASGLEIPAHRLIERAEKIADNSIGQDT